MEWYSASPRERTLLYYALKSGEIDSRIYIEWAKNHYGLPAISESFFETDIPLDLWTKYTQIKWSEEVVPLCEWDGALSIAVIAPLENPPENVVQILAPLECTEIWYRTFEVLGQRPVEAEADPFFLEMQAEKREPPPPPEDEKTLAIPGDAPPPPRPDFTQTQNLARVAMKTSSNLLELQDIDDDDESKEQNDEREEKKSAAHQEDPLESSEQPEDKVADEEWPEGLGPMPAKKPNKSFLNENLNSSAYESEPETSDSIDDMPEGMAPMAQVKSTAESEPETQTVSELMVFSKKEQKPAPAPAKATAKPAPAAASNASSQGETIIHFPSSEGGAHGDDNEKTRVTGGNESVLVHLWKQHRNRIEQIIQHSFKEMRTVYKQVMMLQVEGANVKPWIWDETFKPLPRPQRIPLTENSIFRIVYKTMKAYHGWVANNPVNKIFFDNWTEAAVPPHITIVPLIQNEQLIGLLLGIAENDIAMKPSLQLAEKVAHQISGNLSSLSHSRKSA